MNNFFNNLNKREKYLIIRALMALFLFIIFSISTNLVSSFNISSKQLSKAKSDYEYVVSKVEILNRTVTKSNFNIRDLDSFLKGKSDVVIESEITEDKDVLKIKFLTKDLQDSIAISDEVSGKINMSLTLVEYSKTDQQSQTILYFN